MYVIDGSDPGESGSTSSTTASPERSLYESFIILALFLVAFLIPAGPELGDIGLRPEDVLLVALSMIYLLEIVRKPKLEIIGGKFLIGLLAVWTLSILSTILGTWQETAVLLSLDPLKSGLLTIIKEAELIALFLLVGRYVRSRKIALSLISALCFGGTTLSALVIIELLFLKHGEIVPHLQFHLMGEIFGFVASLSAGRLLFGSPTRPEKYLYTVYFLISGVGVFASGEAGAIIGGAGAVAMMTVISIEYSRINIRERIVAIIFVLGVSAFALLVVLFPSLRGLLIEQVADLISILSGNPNHSVDARFRNWTERIPEVLTTRPLFGFGQLAINPGWIDNEYVQRLYYTGLFGLVAYLYLLLIATRTAFTGARKDRTGILAGYAGVLGVMLLAGLAKGVFHSTKTSAFFVMCSALVYVLMYRDS